MWYLNHSEHHLGSSVNIGTAFAYARDRSLVLLKEPKFQSHRLGLELRAVLGQRLGPRKAVKANETLLVFLGQHALRRSTMA